MCVFYENAFNWKRVNLQKSLTTNNVRASGRNSLQYLICLKSGLKYSKTAKDDYLDNCIQEALMKYPRTGTLFSTKKARK